MTAKRYTLSVILMLTLLAGCKPLVNLLAFHPDSSNIINPDRFPPGVEEVSFETEDNIRLVSLYLRNQASKQLLIYFHGNGGNIYHRITDLQILNKAGVSVLGVAYRGYGKSTGEPSEAGIYKDGEAALKYASRQLGYSDENIFILGRSIGTTVAVNTAQKRRLAGVILVTPLTSAREQAKSSALAPIAFLAGDAFDNLSKIHNLQAPLLVIHGTHDRVIPYAMGKAIFTAAKVEKDFITIKGADHNNLQSSYAWQYWEPILMFIQRSLAGG